MARLVFKQGSAKQLVIYAQAIDTNLSASLPPSGFSNRAAEDSLNQLRIPPADRPLDIFGQPLMPEMPPDLDSATIGEVVKLQGEFSKLAGFLEERFAESESDASEAEAILLNTEAKVHLTKGGTIADKKAKVLIDQNYIEAQAESLRKTAIAKLIRGKLRSCERHIAALSRAQSAKESELNRRFAQ